MTAIRVTKWNQRGEIIAEAQVETLSEAHAFLDNLNEDGTVKAPVRATRQIAHLSGDPQDATEVEIENDEAAFERRFAGEHPDADYLGRPA